MNVELMKIVERTVRPVRAGKSRKLRMREELYSQLEAIFQEERNAGLSPLAAIAAAKRRFGEPRELQRELQQTISPAAQASAMIDGWIARRPEEPLWRFATRTGSLFGGGIVLFFGTGAVFFDLDGSFFQQTWHVLALAGVCMSISAAALTCLHDWALAACDKDAGRTLAKRVCQFVATALGAGVVFSASLAMIVFNTDRLLGIEFRFPWLGATSMASIVFALLTISLAGKNVRLRIWNALPLEAE